MENYGERLELPIEYTDTFEEPCNGKISYRSEHHAHLARVAAYKRRTRKLRIYQCDSCHNWHLTSLIH